LGLDEATPERMPTVLETIQSGVKT